MINIIFFFIFSNILDVGLISKGLLWMLGVVILIV